MKLNVKAVKSVSTNKNTLKKVIAIAVSLLVIIVSYNAIQNASKEAQDTINVVRVKTKGGLPMYSVITKESIESYALTKKEYTEDMVRAEDIDKLYEQYTMYFLREKGIVYKDQIGSEKPLQNEWLYELEEEYEVITLPYNYLECGGDILMPGDRIRIRAVYEDTATSEETSYVDPNLYVYKQGEKNMKSEIIFDSIIITDMLNSNSHSIYEIYKEVLRLGEDERQKVLKSKDFINSVLPKSLILAGTKDQVNEYARYKTLGKGDFVITILSRKNSQAIMDQLPTLQSEVQTWIEKEESN